MGCLSPEIEGKGESNHSSESRKPHHSLMIERDLVRHQMGHVDGKRDGKDVECPRQSQESLLDTIIIVVVVDAFVCQIDSIRLSRSERKRQTKETTKRTMSNSPRALKRLRPR